MGTCALCKICRGSMFPDPIALPLRFKLVYQLGSAWPPVGREVDKRTPSGVVPDFVMSSVFLMDSCSETEYLPLWIGSVMFGL